MADDWYECERIIVTDKGASNRVWPVQEEDGGEMAKGTLCLKYHAEKGLVRD